MGQGYDNGDSYYSQYPTDDNKYEYRTAGATLIVSARWIKKEERTSIQKIDNVIPVAPKETASLLEKKCDQLEIITKPATSSFHSVSQYHKDFKPIDDEQVLEILKSGIRRKNISGNTLYNCVK
jgi:predicted phosphoribosyltransferase